MARFALRRAGSMVLVLLAVSVLTFLIFNVIPGGDPAERMAGKVPTESNVAAIREEWGFDESLPVQYATMMRKVFTGDLRSYFTQLDVGEEIARGLPATLSLAFGAAVLSLGLSIAIGLLGAVRAGRACDRVLTVLALVGVSLPVFWIGALMSHYLGFELGWFPNGGYVGITDDPLAWLHHMALPWTALSILLVGFYSRVLRASLLEAMEEDYVRTARAKGLSERRVLLRHALRNSMAPVVTLWGLDLGFVLGGGAILTEAVFDLQGVGQYAAESVAQLDQPPVVAVTLLGASAIVVVNAVVDIVHAALDPRVRVVG